MAPPSHLAHKVSDQRELLVVLVAAQQVKGQPEVLFHVAWAQQGTSGRGG